MCEPSNIREVVDLGVDYIGFIFYEKSPRFIQNPPVLQDFGKAKKVGVFVNASLALIEEKIDEFALDMLQLHGGESVAFCEQLQTKLQKRKNEQKNIEIIKVFSVDEYFDFSALEAFIPFTNYFLFDTKGKNLGGNGVRFDWSILKKYPFQVPFFLSGGIDLPHIEAIKALKDLPIYALDINSCFELRAGLKDISKIQKFLELLTKFTQR